LTNTLIDTIPLMTTHRQNTFVFLVLLFWGVFFFRNWAGLLRIKAWELQVMVGQSREVQLQVLHPTGEMKHLLELRQILSSPSSSGGAVIVAPTRDSALPQGHNASILRAVMYPIPVEADPERLQQNDLLVVIVASSSASIAAQVTCPTMNANCPCYSLKTQQQEVLCWHMPTP
jgi:hypothetical protein